MRTLRRAMRDQAGWVWGTMARAAKLGLSFNEETITETVLFNLATVAQGRDFWVFPFTKAAEASNGADWEFWFQQGTNLVGLRVQAKRIFRSGAYDSLDVSGEQIDKLIAQARGCIPVYVFYNGLVGGKLSEHAQFSATCKSKEFRGRTYSGCSIALATDVKKHRSNNPSVIAQFSVPLHCIFCKDNDHLILSYLGFAPYITALTAEAEGSSDFMARMFRARVGELKERAQSGQDADPDWLDRYLDDRALAGVVIFSSTDASSQ
jgi:hypothetical protein